MDEFYHGYKPTFISEDATEEIKKVSTFSFFSVIWQVQKNMGSDWILFWSE